jgi:photosystem II stability/assembly factor-like uncharacterized protein
MDLSNQPPYLALRDTDPCRDPAGSRGSNLSHVMRGPRDFDTITVPAMRRLRTVAVVVAATVLVLGSTFALVHPQIPGFPARQPSSTATPDHVTLALFPDFLDASHGWINVAHPPQEEGDGLYSTLNGGRSWQRMSNLLSGPFQFVDTRNGVALNQAQASVTLTTDGGRTWTPARGPALPTAHYNGAFGFSDPRHGILLERTPDAGLPGGQLWLTDNRTDWRPLPVLDLTRASTLAVSATTYLVTDVVSNGVRAYVSPDAGKTWRRSVLQQSATATWGLAASPGLIVGIDDVHGSQFAVSTDLGATWTITQPPASGPIAGRLACRSSGLCTLSDGEWIVHSTGFGLKGWSPRTPSPFPGGRLSYAPDGTLFAIASVVGSGGGRTDQLFSSRNDGQTWRQIRLP